MATLQRKIEARFFEKKVSPGRPVHQFIAELDIVLQNLHQDKSSSVVIPQSIVQSQDHRISRNKKNYGRTLKRLKYKICSTNTVLQKTDKSKVFQLGEIEHYQKKSEEYMAKTQAYHCLGTEDPLPDLVRRTNKYLLDLRLIKWISQKQYEQLCVKQTDEVELAHLYYLPKTHKPGTPLRPIVSGLKHPTIKISKFLDNILRPLFDQMATSTTVTCGLELIKQLQDWSKTHMRQETLLCTIDVTDLYTMIPQVEGVLSLKKMLDYLHLKQISDLRIEVILCLARFVMQNNYFSYNGQYYHQIRGGAMGSPLTLTVTNCYMFFFEQSIKRQISNGHGLYFRYIDDIFITINWPQRHFLKEIDRWNKIDDNIRLSANISHTADFLDLHMENKNGELFTSVFHKPSYEPYYLPFNSIHPLHMKKNIPFAMLLRGLRYCSSFDAYLDERAKLRMALLLNKYPGHFVDQQFHRLFYKFGINEPLGIHNYESYRQKILDSPIQSKTVVDHSRTMFVHFTYCSNMRTFPSKFHTLWQKYFMESPINDIVPVLGTRNVQNLQRRLVHTRHRAIHYNS